MSQKQIKRMKRKLESAGVTALAGRVWRRLKREYGATPSADRQSFLVLAGVRDASQRAYLAAWGRMTPAQRAKFDKGAEA